VTEPDRDKEGGEKMPITTPEADTIVQFGGRIPSSLRRRVRIAAAAQDIDAQTALRQALEEYVTKRGF
jgi:predicted DNA binding CopG/RHH family protein